MREIKFRAKRLDNGEWLHGDLLHLSGGETIISDPDAMIGFDKAICDPDTIGQYTGLKDKNGKEIFEGDILNVTDEDYSGGIIGINLEVIHNDKLAAFTARASDCPEDDEVSVSEYAPIGVVLGNIYDNPELLEGGEE